MSYVAVALWAFASVGFFVAAAGSAVTGGTPLVLSLVWGLFGVVTGWIAVLEWGER